MLNLLIKVSLKRLARRLLSELKSDYGTKQYYSAVEIEEVCNNLGITAKKKPKVYAMFADEVVFKDYLKKINSEKHPVEIRKNCFRVIFGEGSYNGYGLWNRFHDYDNEVGGGIGSIGNSSSTYSSSNDTSDGGFDASGYGDGGFD